jgi:hypothetical protein
MRPSGGRCILKYRHRGKTQEVGKIAKKPRKKHRRVCDDEDGDPGIHPAYVPDWKHCSTVNKLLVRMCGNQAGAIEQGIDTLYSTEDGYF